MEVSLKSMQFWLYWLQTLAAAANTCGCQAGKNERSTALREVADPRITCLAQKRVRVAPKLDAPGTFIGPSCTVAWGGVCCWDGARSNGPPAGPPAAGNLTTPVNECVRVCMHVCKRVGANTRARQCETRKESSCQLNRASGSLKRCTSSGRPLEYAKSKTGAKPCLQVGLAGIRKRSSIVASMSPKCNCSVEK